MADQSGRLDHRYDDINASQSINSVVISADLPSGDTNVKNPLTGLHDNNESFSSQPSSKRHSNISTIKNKMYRFGFNQDGASPTSIAPGFTFRHAAPRNRSSLSDDNDDVDADDDNGGFREKTQLHLKRNNHFENFDNSSVSHFHQHTSRRRKYNNHSKFSHDSDCRHNSETYRPNVISADSRPIITSFRHDSTTPERLIGMAPVPQRFRSLDELTDSDTEETPSTNHEVTKSTYDYDCGESSTSGKIDDTAMHTSCRKRIKLSHSHPTSNNRSSSEHKPTPKWSNPDPYTILPLTDEVYTKRKDVVKLIRKAKLAPTLKVTGENDLDANSAANQETDEITLKIREKINCSDKVVNAAAQAVISNDDFISFDFDEPSSSNEEVYSLSPSPCESHTDEEKSAKTFRPIHEITGVRGLRSGSKYPDEEESFRPDNPHNLQDSYTALADNELYQRKSKRRNRSPSRSPPSRPSYTRRPKKNGPSNGSITEEWTRNPNTPATPWCTEDYSMIQRMGHWLSMEIYDFYNFVKPQAFENEIRQNLITRLGNFLQRQYPEGKLHSFGSFAAGMYLPSADMDLVFVSQQYEQHGAQQFAHSSSWMWRLARKLEDRGFAKLGSTEVVWGAKVPIIKYIDRLTLLRVDISFEQINGVRAIEIFKAWKTEYPMLPILASVIKQFLLMRNLNEVYSGGIGGYTVTCLIVSLLQHHPGISSGNMAKDQYLHLGDLLMNFFDLYGSKFNIFRTGIQMEQPGYFSKIMMKTRLNAQPNRLTILDPDNPLNDISGGSSNIETVQRVFAEAFTKLHQRMLKLDCLSINRRKHHPSILSCILAGNYSRMESVRKHLRNLHDKLLAEGLDFGAKSHSTRYDNSEFLNFSRKPRGKLYHGNSGSSAYDEYGHKHKSASANSCEYSRSSTSRRRDWEGGNSHGRISRYDASSAARNSAARMSKYSTSRYRSSTTTSRYGH